MKRETSPYRLVLISTLLGLAILAVLTCDTDHGLGLLPSIRGRIIFRGTPPDTSGQVIVVVSPDFPPSQWTDIIRTPPLPIDQDTVEYELPLPYGTYDVVGVLWKNKDEEWSFETVSNILGVYTEPNLFKPKPVTLTREDFGADSVDIIADYGLVRYGAYLTGTITYTGTWRDDTDMMILASFPMKPEKVVDYLFALGWDLTIPVKESAYPFHYRLDVAPAYHKYVALFWKGEKSSPYDFKKIAEFEFPDDPPLWPGMPPPVGTWVSEGDTLKADLVADFSRINTP